MNNIPLRLQYLGKRNYVNGATLYSIVTEKLQIQYGKNSNFNINIIAHDFVTKNCDFVYANSPSKIIKPNGAKIEISSSSLGLQGWLIENKKQITTRVEFLEEEIIKECIITKNKSALISSDINFKPIEVLIAITKHLHNAEYPIKEGKWIFTRLQLDRLLVQSDIQNLKIQIKQNIANRLTKTVVLSGQENIGYIYFSVSLIWPQ